MPSPPFIATLFSVHFPLSRPHGEGAGGGFPSVLPPVSPGCSCPMPGQCRGPLSPGCASSPLLAPELEGGDSRGAGTGSWPWQVAGQGRVCFCAGHKERSPRGTKRVKNVSVKALGLPELCSPVSRLVLCWQPAAPGAELGAFCLLYSFEGTSLLCGAE